MHTRQSLLQWIFRTIFRICTCQRLPNVDFWYEADLYCDHLSESPDQILFNLFYSIKIIRARQFKRLKFDFVETYRFHGLINP